MKYRLLLLAAFPAALACSNTSEPPDPGTPKVRYTAVAVGYHRTCVLDDAGALYCWGLDNSKFAADEQLPVRRTMPEPLVSITADDELFCGTGVSGALYCWGAYENLGAHTAFSINGGARVAGLDVGAGHGCGLAADSTVRCFGVMNSGRMGRTWDDPTNQDRTDLLLAPVASTWRFTALGAGITHTCGLRPTGDVACWGDSLAVGNPVGPFLRTANPCIATRTMPCTIEPLAVVGLTGVTSLAVGSHHNCALAGGKTYCWGGNWGDQLGFRGNDSPVPIELTVPVALTQLSAGAASTCGLGVNDKVYCWGRWEGGVVGPTVVPGAYPRFAAMAVGTVHSCGVTNGEVYCWGDSTWLGDGSGRKSAAPVRVAQPKA